MYSCSPQRTAAIGQKLPSAPPPKLAAGHEQVFEKGDEPDQFCGREYAGKRKKTRRAVFLEEMELVVPWKVLRTPYRLAPWLSNQFVRTPMAIPTSEKMQLWHGSQRQAEELGIHDRREG
jgi:hypothetical protein